MKSDSTNRALGYSINHTTNTIVMTKRFQREASQIGTEAYNVLKRLRRDFPHMHLMTKPTRRKKTSSARLTYSHMWNYIACLPDSEKWQEQFAQVRKLSRSQPSAYHYVVNWFMNTFPGYSDCPTFDERGKLIYESNVIPFPAGAENTDARAERGA